MQTTVYKRPQPRNNSESNQTETNPIEFTFSRIAQLCLMLSEKADIVVNTFARCQHSKHSLV